MHRASRVSPRHPVAVDPLHDALILIEADAHAFREVLDGALAEAGEEAGDDRCHGFGFEEIGGTVLATSLNSRSIRTIAHDKIVSRYSASTWASVQIATR
jgi:hypothetical protein